MYKELQAEPIIATIDTLVRRIRERFPEASLCGVADEVLQVARAAPTTIGAIRRPAWGLRIGVAVLGAVMLWALVGVIEWNRIGEIRRDIAEFVQALDAGINCLVLVGAAVLFLITVEKRVKRRRALGAMHQLRSLAHVVDMHQLSKDPERLVMPGRETASSPKLTLSAFDLGRYLEYCIELLALISKIGALYAQHFEDEVALSSVDELADLTTGLSREIWQKMMILNKSTG